MSRERLTELARTSHLDLVKLVYEAESALTDMRRQRDEARELVKALQELQASSDENRLRAWRQRDEAVGKLSRISELLNVETWEDDRDAARSIIDSAGYHAIEQAWEIASGEPHPPVSREGAEE